MHRGAFQLTLENTLYGVIHEGNVTLKTAERKANELLDSMETGPERYDFVDGEAVAGETAIINNSIGDTDASPKNDVAAAAAGNFEADSPQPREIDGQETEESATDLDKMEGGKWAAPRPQAGSRTNTGSGNQEPHGNDLGGSNGGRGDTYLSLEPCLGQVMETHRRACKRYANQVAELEAQNAALASRAAEASRLEGEAVEQAKLWEARHDALAERLASVEKRAREDLDLAEERAAEARSRSLEVAGEMREKLERATPTLLELVAGFAPRDTEGAGLRLFRSLGIEPDLYAHLVATKRMFEVGWFACARAPPALLVDGEHRLSVAATSNQRSSHIPGLQSVLTETIFDAAEAGVFFSHNLRVMYGQHGSVVPCCGISVTEDNRCCCKGRFTAVGRVPVQENSRNATVFLFFRTEKRRFFALSKISRPNTVGVVRKTSRETLS